MPKLEVTLQERRQYPTYKTANRIVHGDMTAPVEFLGWTMLRACIIAPGVAIAGVRGKKLIFASLFGSSFVSLFALYRTYTTKNMEKHQSRMREFAESEHEMLMPPRRRRRRPRPRSRSSRTRRRS